MVTLPCHMRVKEEVKLTMTADYLFHTKAKKGRNKRNLCASFQAIHWKKALWQRSNSTLPLESCQERLCLGVGWPSLLLMGISLS
jgi:hypothetical protein